MKKYLIFLIAIIACSGCSVVSKQYYYVPNTAHTTTKDHSSYFKMLNSKVGLSDSSGNNIGSLSTSNGIGIPLLAGPPYVPVIPVGLVSVFYKGDTQFEMDINVTSNQGYFMPLAIDSNNFKSTRDSLNTKRMMTAMPLQTNECYMIVNGSQKIPLKIKEFFMGSTAGHSYRLTADVNFAKVRTVTIVTGNILLDNTLKNITYQRKKRLTYCVMGFS